MADWGKAFGQGYDSAQDRAQRERQLALQAEIERGGLSLRRAAEERQKRQQQLLEQEQLWDRENPELGPLKRLYEQYPTPDAEPHTARAFAYSRELARLKDPTVATAAALGEYNDPATGERLAGVPMQPMDADRLRTILSERRGNSLREAYAAFERAQNETLAMRASGRGGSRGVPYYAKDLEIAERELQRRLSAIGDRRQGVFFVNNQAQFLQDIMGPGEAAKKARAQMDDEEFQLLQQLRNMELAYGRRAKQYGQTWDQPLMSDSQYATMRAREINERFTRSNPAWATLPPEQKTATIRRIIEAELQRRAQGVFADPYAPETR